MPYRIRINRIKSSRGCFFRGFCWYCRSCSSEAAVVVSADVVVVSVAVDHCILVDEKSVRFIQ